MGALEYSHNTQPSFLDSCCQQGATVTEEGAARSS